ncbi:hypothetical protein ACFWY9_34745 [Amycolatopsis sp. NPDC059027]|uniref:hypothetical protein n=1 Tax=unclassified Amycolatopsis TaxID=2618356 RepID=UPI00366E7299
MSAGEKKNAVRRTCSAIPVTTKDRFCPLTTTSTVAPALIPFASAVAEPTTTWSAAGAWPP